MSVAKEVKYLGIIGYDRIYSDEPGCEGTYMCTVFRNGTNYYDDRNRLLSWTNLFFNKPNIPFKGLTDCGYWKESK